jgi:hypothetical protein
MQVDLVSVHALARDLVPYRIKCSEFTPVIAHVFERGTVNGEPVDLYDYFFGDWRGARTQVSGSFFRLRTLVGCN